MSKKSERIEKLVQLMNTNGELRIAKYNTEVVLKHVQSILAADGVFLLKEKQP